MTSEEHYQQELEEQEWQEILKADPGYRKFIEDLEEGDERYINSTQATVSSKSA